jgi:hypothetical protein
LPRLGVIGSLVWDEIHGRDPAAPPVEEWGGIAYGLAGLDASLADGWEIVPLIKVGIDLAMSADVFLHSLERVRRDARFVAVGPPTNRVVMRYTGPDRRTERMSGGVPAWTWEELGPMVADLDALLVNFISGFEMSLGTAELLRQGFRGPIYADLHSLFLGMQADGMRVPQPLPDAPSWFGCFDVVQVNEDEMRLLHSDPMTLATAALAAGTRMLVVTLGPRGAAYVADATFDGFGRVAPGAAVRTALIPAPVVDAIDPTGSGDVFGATAMSRLLAGDGVEPALKAAAAMAARNATVRGAETLSRVLKGALVTP